ncbi:MAG: carboxypeptidase-like regulatory domain-containing protein, partial [Pseudomonadota bacterium]
MKSASQTSRVKGQKSNLAGLALALLLAAPLAAQSYRGAIRGVVEDPSGAVVPGGAVTAKNAATGERRGAMTGEDGAYIIPELPAGRYQLTVEAKGFSTEVREAQVDVGLDTTADFALKVGPAGETVT